MFSEQGEQIGSRYDENARNKEHDRPELGRGEAPDPLPPVVAAQKFDAEAEHGIRRKIDAEPRYFGLEQEYAEHDEQEEQEDALKQLRGDHRLADCGQIDAVPFGGLPPVAAACEQTADASDAVRSGDRARRDARDFEKVLLREFPAEDLSDGKISCKKDSCTADEPAVKGHAAPLKDARLEEVIDRLEQDRAAHSCGDRRNGGDIDEILKFCRDLEEVGIDAHHGEREHDSDEQAPVVQLKT